MPALRNHVPEENLNISVKDLIDELFDGDQKLEVV
jgi:hypothetical protein